VPWYSTHRRPQRPQGRDHLVEALAARREVLAGLVELLLAPPDAHPEPDPVGREGGGSADGLGHRDEVAHRGDVDAGREGELRVMAASDAMVHMGSGHAVDFSQLGAPSSSLA